MHPSSVLQLLLLNIFISPFAAGQQSFYSINGQHQQQQPVTGAVASSLSSSFSPSPSSSSSSSSAYQIQPNLAASSYVGSNSNYNNNNFQQQYTSNSNYGLNQQSSYGVSSQQQQQQPTYQNYANQLPTTTNTASQSQQHYSYAPAPFSHTQNSQYGQQYTSGSGSNVQPATSSQPQNQQNSYYYNQQQYGSTPVTYGQQQYSTQQQQQQSAYAPASSSSSSSSSPSYDPSAATLVVSSSSSASAIPYQQQSSQNNQFSQRVGAYSSGSPYASQPTMAMNAPITSSFSQSVPVPVALSSGPGGVSGVSLSQNQFMSRRGPFDGMISRVKEWMPSGKARGKPPYSAGMSEMNRLPKPPKYPLYDMPTAGMATPPPPPLMSPMSNMPSGMYSSFSNPIASGSAPQPQRGGRPSHHLSSHPGGSGIGIGIGGHSSPHPPRRLKNNKQQNKRRRNRPPPPPPPSPPKYRQNKRGQRPRVKGVKLTNPRGGNTYSKPLNAIHEGFDHPMASNVNPVNSPPLGRPLGYDEYMKKPTHSFTDDPWNFDPNAQSYNEGMNTYAMKYNYDPLGMNALDTSVQTHLDANKMSYPGDIMNMESYKERPKPLSSQLGGWDTYSSNSRNQGNNNQNNNNYNNNNNNNNYNNNNNNNNYNSNYNSHRSGPSSSSSSSSSNDFSRFDDHIDGSSTITFEDVQSSTKNSFNPYDPVTEASIVQSETMNPLTLLGESGGTIEFDIDSGLRGNNNNNNNNNNGGDRLDNGDRDRDSISSGSGSGSGSNSRNLNNNNNNNNNYDDYNTYKLSDHYSASDDSGSYQNSPASSSSPYDSQNDNNNNYDHYSNSKYYNNYSNKGGNEYGRRQVRTPARTPLHSSHSHNVKLNSKSQSSSSFSTLSSSSLSSPVLDEGMGLFHDFIKDPSPGAGKARARHSLYKALLS